MARNWAYKCQKQGHIPAEGWTDEPQLRKDGRLFVTHICDHCGVLFVRLLPLKSVSALMGPRGEALVSEGGEE